MANCEYWLKVPELGYIFKEEIAEEGETGTIYIELSSERNFGSLACRIIDSIAKFDS